MKKRKLCNLAIFLMLVSLTAPLAFHYPYQDFTQKVSLDLKPNSNIGFRSAFLGANANASVIEQCNMGYRIPNSSASLECAWYIHDKLETYGLEAEFQDFVGESGEGAGVKFRNVIGTLRTDKETNRTLLLGAHYDTRPFSNTNVSIPVMGANDGASGVAILLELARIFGENATKFNFTIKMLFFDGEDFGNGTNSMFYGSRYYASNMSAEEISNTVGMILLDMVGDADLQIYREGFSDSNLTDMLMNAASKLGYLSDGSPGFQGFYNSLNHYVIDDHIQFKDKGIPSIDIIDFDYPYWHTDEDTPDKVSAQSLEIVGRTVEQLVYMINEKESAKSKPVGIIDRISPSPAILGEKVFFNSSGIDEDGNVVAYKWISDIDGIISTERNFSISNLSAGTHMITLIVTDNDGLESIPVTQILIVNEIRVELGDEYIVPAGITTEFKLNELNLSENGKIRIFGKLTLTKTYIKLGNNGSIIVESMGSLEAKDTVFDSKGGYELVSYGKVLIENCTLKNISYAKPERELDEIYAPKESGLRIYSSESRIANSSISGCKGLGIMCINSSPEIIGNKIWNNQEGAILLYNSSAKIINNKIYENMKCGCAGSQPAVQIFKSNPRIEWNNISNNGGNGIAAFYSNLRIVANHFSYNEYHVYLLYCNAQILQNTFAYGIHGVWADFSDLNIEGNIFFRNYVSAIDVYYYSGYYLDAEHIVYIRENRFENNNCSVIAGGLEPIYDNNTFVEDEIRNKEVNVRIIQKWLLLLRYFMENGTEIPPLDCDTKLTNGTKVISYIPSNYTEVAGYIVLVDGFKLILSYYVNSSYNSEKGYIENVTKISLTSNMELCLILKKPESKKDKLVVDFDENESSLRLVAAVSVFLIGILFITIERKTEKKRISEKEIEEKMKKLKFKNEKKK